MSALRELYEEMILDHNRNPRNYNRMPAHANRHAHGYNPICDDEFTVHVELENGVIKDIGFEGAGCAISTASASLMTESLKGKTEQEAREIFEDVHGLLVEKSEPGAAGKLQVLAGVHEYPMRIKCATLPWHTFRAALDQKEETVSTEQV
jgi:nitrogen fixation NifU-like protein